MTLPAERLSETEAIYILREHCCGFRGVKRRLALAAGVSDAYVNQWANGTQTATRLPESLLHALGLRRVSYIERIPTDAN